MRCSRLLVPLALTVLLAACADRGPVEPPSGEEPSAVRTFVIYGQPIALGGPDTRQPIGWVQLQLQRLGLGDNGIIIIGGYDWATPRYALNWTIVMVNGGGNTPQGAGAARIGGDGNDRVLLDLGGALDGMRCERLAVNVTTVVPAVQHRLVQQLFGDPGGFELSVPTSTGGVLAGRHAEAARPTESLALSRSSGVLDPALRLGDPIPTERFALAGLRNATGYCQNNL